MTKPENDNLKEECHAPAKCFEGRSSCWGLDIRLLGRPELVAIVEDLPQRGKRRGVMSLSAKGDVIFVNSSGQDTFFARSRIADVWSFVHRRLLLVLALENDRKTHDLHFFSMHRRRGIELVFKLRKRVSEGRLGRLNAIRAARTQETFEAQLEEIQLAARKSPSQPAPGAQGSSPASESFVNSPSLPPSASQSSAGSWFDVLSNLQLEPALQQPANPFREAGSSGHEEITNPFVLNAVRSCFRSPLPSRSR